MRLLCALLLFASPALAQDAQPAQGRLLDLTSGDIACYVQLQVDGTVSSYPGAFELCETDAPIGAEVDLLWEQASVYAASCEGDMNCKDLETIWLVVSIEPAS